MVSSKGSVVRYKLAFHPLVRADLVEASTWYALQREGLGERFEIEVNVVFKRLVQQPMIHSIRVADVRRVNLPSFPYGISYFVAAESVVVLALLHGARDTRKVLAARRESYPL
ncbi:MAG: type II toxin-antitoxin system RelE/ParE family toxin [Verrucomicrobiota bacterium]